MSDSLHPSVPDIAMKSFKNKAKGKSRSISIDVSQD
jgi:hypothetical protein